MGRGQIVASFLKEVASLPWRALSLVSFAGLVILALTLALFTLFLVHQLSLWISLDPEHAFHRAKSIVTTYATVWNTVGNVWNGFTDVLLVAIPGWNSAVMYMAEPLVYTTLDVFSIAFTRSPYNGVITEESVPYEGFRCPVDGSMDSASEWCGKVAFYSSQLGVASGSTSSFINNSTVVLSTQTTRRLSEMTGEPIVGSLDLSFLMDAIQSLLGAFIVIMGELSDIVFHVAWSVLSEVFELLFNLFIMLVKAFSSIVMMMVRTGLLQSVLSFGLNLIVVVIMDIMVPYLFAMINIILCFLDLTQVSGWVQQIQCSKFYSPNTRPHTPHDSHTLVKLCHYFYKYTSRATVQRTCFQQGSDVVGEVFHTFSSIPPVARTIQTVFMKLTNQQTGQSYSSSSSGQIEVPNIEAGSAETPRAAVCAECFNCKVYSPRRLDFNFVRFVFVYSLVMPLRFAGSRVQSNLSTCWYNLWLCARR